MITGNYQRQGDAANSAYTNDPRIQWNDGDTFAVTCNDGSTVQVERFDADWWQVPPIGGSRTTNMHAKLDQAFYSLIGDPR